MSRWPEDRESRCVSRQNHTKSPRRVRPESAPWQASPSAAAQLQPSSVPASYPYDSPETYADSEFPSSTFPPREFMPAARPPAEWATGARSHGEQIPELRRPGPSPVINPASYMEFRAMNLP